MGNFALFMHFQILGIWSNIGDAVQHFLGTGDYDSTKIQNAYNTLDNVRPYLHFNDAVGQILNWLKWGALKTLYNLANAAQQITTEALDYRKLLSSAGITEQYQGYVLGAATAIMTAMLIWIGVKYMLGKEKLGVQHIIMQALISIFLMLNISTITNWVAEQASNFYSDAISEKNGNKYSNSIPFDLVAKNTNDLMYMYASNWKGYGTKDNGKIKTQYREHFGSNGWIEDGKPTDDGQDMFEQLSANDLAMSITPDQADIMQKELDKFAKKKGWATEKVRPEYLKYRLVDGGDKPAAIKIGKSNIPFSNAFKGGYSRYTVAALPVAFCLGCLAVAFFFITYLIIKTFLDMAIMQIIGVVVFSTDLETGQKTKAVVQDIFTSAITLCCQAVELMFYRIAADWIISQDFSSKGMTGIVVECMGFLALTMMLIVGSQKTTKFFGVDTGAQKGFATTALAINQTMGALKKTGGAIKGAGKVARGSFSFAADSADKINSGLEGISTAHKNYKNAKQEAESNGTPMKLSDKMNAMGSSIKSGYHAAKAHKDTRKEFLKAGGSRYEWAAAESRGMTDAPIAAKKARYDANGMKDQAYNSLRGQIDPYPSAVRDQNEGNKIGDKPNNKESLDQQTQGDPNAPKNGQKVANEQTKSFDENGGDSVKTTGQEPGETRKLSEKEERKAPDQNPGTQSQNNNSEGEKEHSVAQDKQGQNSDKVEAKRENSEIKNAENTETKRLSENTPTKQNAEQKTASEPKNSNAANSPSTGATSQAPTNETRKISEKTEQSPKSSFKPTSAPEVSQGQTKNTVAHQKGDKTNVKVEKEPNEIRKNYQEGNPKISENRKIASGKGRSIQDITKGKQIIRNENATVKGDKTNMNIRRQNEINRNVEDVTKINEKANQTNQVSKQINHSVKKPNIKQAPKHGDFNSGKDK